MTTTQLHKVRLSKPQDQTICDSKKVEPLVLSEKDVDRLPLETFENNTSRSTGGWKQIFNAPSTPTNELNLGIAYLPPRGADQESFLALHRHKQAEFYYMLRGECTVRIEEVEYRCQPGHYLFIPGDAEHGIWNTSSTEELVFLWGFAADGFGQIIYRFSEGGNDF